MSFYPQDRDVPELLVNEEFVLRPLKPAHVHIDYEAVIASRKMLRLWSGTDWPRDGFTLAENLDDLQWHHKEQVERKAFTYTVLDPDQATCLGCIYIRPLTELVAANPGTLVNINQDEAITRFWVRTSHIASGLDLHLLKTLINWFAEQWQFSRLLFHTRQENLQQLTLFEAVHMQKEFTLHYSERGGFHLFFGAV